MYLNINKFQSLKGGSYIKTPKWIKDKHSIINVQNLNDECFRYALTCAVDRPKINKCLVAYYDHPDRKSMFNLTDIEFPTPVSDKTFSKFEKQNPLYKLSVFMCSSTSKSKSELETCYISDLPDENRTHILLLVIYDNERFHYTTITNFRGLNYSGINNEHYCMRCLYAFAGIGAEDRLVKHIPECNGVQNGRTQRIEMPEVGSTQSFTSYDNTTRIITMCIRTCILE